MRQRLDDKYQAVHRAHDDVLVFRDRRRAACMPCLALEPDFAVAGEVFERLGHAADDRTLARHGAASPEPEQVANEPDQEGREYDGDTDHEGVRDAVTGHVRVEHDDRSEHKGGNAADAERAETRRIGLRHDEPDAHDDQGEARVVDRQDLETVGRKQQADCADHARHDGAGIPAFVHESVEADQAENEHDFRVRDHAKKAQAPVRLKDIDLGIGGRQHLRAGR